MLSFARRLAGNLLFLAILLVVVVAWLGGRGPRIPERAVLVVDPTGNIVEESSEALLADPLLRDSVLSETLLRDVVEAIDQAAGDRRIQGVLLDLGRLEGAGLSKLQEIGAALARFRASGKFVVSRSDFYSQRGYYLAAQADRVYLHPMGLVMLTGFGVFNNYYKTALDRLLLRFHVFKVGTYKSALEPFTRSDMSEADRQANAALLTTLWERYKSDVSARRGLNAGAVDDYISGLPRLLEETGGDPAQLALKLGLVDALKTRDQVDEELIGRVGKDPKTHSFNRIGYADYAAALRGKKPKKELRVAVIVARGVIRDGEQPAGAIGGVSLAARIRAAREEESVKALVVRIDSPGGSAFASELIRREIELTRRAGKPVVVSMSSTAASGGYWIASAADEIWAYPTTVTGSIGIFGAFPTFEESLKALGINNDGIGTTPLADAFNPSRPMNPLAAASLQQIVEHGYRTFLRTVSEGRKMAIEDVERLAQGRIWSGEAAQGQGLVDRIGGFREALQSAAEKAGLSDYEVDYFEPEPTVRGRLLKHLTGLLAGLRPAAAGDAALARITRAIAGQEWRDLIELNDPRGIYAYCPDCFQP
jgi:protease-4